MRYLSEAWGREALRLIETHPRIKEALAGVEVSLLLIILGAPKDAYGFLYAAFDRSGLSDYRVGHDYHTITRGIHPTFVVSGRYEVFAAVQQGRLDQRQALLTRKLHLTGPMLKAIRHMRALETLMGVLATIECEV